MKYIAIILSIFTISLSAMPCDDDIADINENIVEFSSDSHNDSHDLGDLCSPFCTCVCCASVMIAPVFAQETLISEELLSELNSFYTFSYSSDHLDRIFQPPKVL